MAAAAMEIAALVARWWGWPGDGGGGNYGVVGDGQ